MYGIATMDLKEGEHILAVLIPSVINDKSGNAYKTSEALGKHINSKGAEISLSSEVGMSVRAVWIGLNSNRVDAPMIKKGMVVELFKYNDDIYRWAYVNNQFDLMKTDKETYLIRSYEDDKMSSEENSHVFQIDMLKNNVFYLRINKTKSGEPVSMDIKVDAKKGIVSYEDSNKNSLILNGDKKILFGEFKEKIHLKTKEFVIDCDTYELNATKSVDVKTKDYKLKGKSTVNITTSSYELSGGQGVFNSSLSMNKNVDFNLTTNFFAKATMNNNARIAGFSTPSSHGPTIE